jgi:hypothetical protein
MCRNENNGRLFEYNLNKFLVGTRYTDRQSVTISFFDLFFAHVKMEANVQDQRHREMHNANGKATQLPTKHIIHDGRV